MKLVDAALEVLRSEGKPLHYQEITSRILERGLWKTSGKTPCSTANARDLSPKAAPAIMLVSGRRKGRNSREETHAGAGHRQARRDRGGDSRARHSRCGRPPDRRDRATLLPPAQRLRESRDRPGQPPEAPEVGEQPPAASRGGPDAGQPDPEAGVWGIFLGPSRRRRSVDSPDNAATGQPARGRADAPTSCPHHTDLGQSCLRLWRRCSICFVL